MSRDTKTNIRFFSPSINHLGTVNRYSRRQACWAYSVITVGLITSGSMGFALSTLVKFQQRYVKSHRKVPSTPRSDGKTLVQEILISDEFRMKPI
jgi:hypothetical protein